MIEIEPGLCERQRNQKLEFAGLSESQRYGRMRYSTEEAGIALYDGDLRKAGNASA